jgi:hypothetical protein
MHFKKMTLLSLNVDQYYSNIVRSKNDCGLELNPNMSEAHSKSLFFATLKALGSNANEVVNTNSTSSDAISLWTKLDNHFHRITSSHVLKTKLKKDYESLQKESNESFTAYITRFETTLETLNHNRIDPGSHTDIAYRYLESLAMPTIFNNILMNLDNDNPKG